MDWTCLRKKRCTSHLTAIRVKAVVFAVRARVEADGRIPNVPFDQGCVPRVLLDLIASATHEIIAISLTLFLLTTTQSERLRRAHVVFCQSHKAYGDQRTDPHCYRRCLRRRRPWPSS